MGQCSKCGSSNINMSATGYSQKKQKNFTGPQCNDCGSWNFQLAQRQSPGSGGGGQSGPSIKLLQMILNELRAIRQALQPKGERVEIDPETELEPDPETPF